MFKLENEIKISIYGIPLPWISKIELYYPDLPQFPIIYIHTFDDNGNRLIACPVSVSYKINQNSCDAEFLLVSNICQSDKNIDIIENELKERIGFSNKITKNDIISCCNGDTNYEKILSDIWTYVERSYGSSLPYGRYYEELFSIVRFVSAWQPKTGRQSEMRMLYNFMSAFGEESELPQKWSHLEFYITPNIEDIKQKNFDEFPNFKVLDSVSKKLFAKYFTVPVKIDNFIFYAMNKAWKQNKDSFINLISTPLYEDGTFNEVEKKCSEKLVDAFNRNARRASFFISTYINIDKNYESWSKTFFNEFYNNGKKLKGYSEKVIACFLQQGFSNTEAIPIDTWIKTFYEFPLGITSNIDFFNTFSNIGKLERMIWLSSQSNKTNMKNFYNILWCQRYGVNGNSELRGINPISCYSCNLKSSCFGLKSHYDDTVYLTDIKDDINSNTNYTCILSNRIPSKCYKSSTLIDEFSGYILSSKNSVPQNLIDKQIITLKDFVFF